MSLSKKFTAQSSLLGPWAFLRQPLPDDTPEVLRLRRRGARQTEAKRSQSTKSSKNDTNKTWLAFSSILKSYLYKPKWVNSMCLLLHNIPS